MGNSFWRDRFGPLPAGTESVPFGDLEMLERKLATKVFGAFVVEPVQGEGEPEWPMPDTGDRLRNYAAARERC